MDFQQPAQQLGQRDSDLSDQLFALADEAYSEFERYGNKPDIDAAIDFAAHSIQLDSKSGFVQLGKWDMAATFLDARYKRFGDRIADLDEAIDLSRMILQQMPPNDENRAAILNDIGKRLADRYEQTNKAADLDKSIRAMREAVALTSDDAAHLYTLLNNLGSVLDCRFKRMSEITDLEEAVELARELCQLTPRNHPNRARRLENLGRILEHKYEQRSTIADLREAILAATEVVELTSLEDPLRQRRLSSLGNMLEARYDRSRQISDLEEAIRIAREVLATTTQNPLSRAEWLSNLGNKLDSWYELTGELASLNELIRVAREAIGLTPRDNPNYGGLLSNLGTHLELLYNQTGNMAVLNEAIKMAREAIKLLSEDNPNRFACLNSLGNTLECRYNKTGDESDLREACVNVYDAWQCHAAIPFRRIKAAARCMFLFASLSDLVTAIHLGRAALDLIPTVNTALLERNDQQHAMSAFAGISTELCSYSLAYGRPPEALEHLELGRAIIIGHMIDLWSLQQSHPNIACRFTQLQEEVNTPASEVSGQNRRQARVAVRRREALEELSACLGEIRSIAGYERFLRCQTVEEMQACAAGGTIVIVNIGGWQADAILVSATSTTAMHLPRLSPAAADKWHNRKWIGKGVPKAVRIKNNQEYLKFLRWLWDVCVEPILDKLGITDATAANTNSLPRIWWIGTGPGSSMPFHAAGIHVRGSTENALSRIISSYTPSIKALAYAKARARTTANMQGSLLFTAMASTPDPATQQDGTKLPDLPGVVQEKEQVASIAAGHLAVETLDLPSAEQVVEKLTGCSIAHFACHGSTDHADPFNSGLVLQKQEGQDVRRDRLTVSQVSELNLAHAHIAYLSACSTAENSVYRFKDEVIHVVSGFQAAGFPHIVGCLWPSIDRVCVRLACEFYQSLFLRQRPTGWEDNDIAYAMRDAVMAVRDEEMEMPLAWAQFVHFGA